MLLDLSDLLIVRFVKFVTHCLISFVAYWLIVICYTLHDLFYCSICYIFYLSNLLHIASFICLYHNVEICEKDQKENSHEKASQSLILLRTHIYTHTQADIYHAHMDTKFLLFCTVVIKKHQQS